MILSWRVTRDIELTNLTWDWIKREYRLVDPNSNWVDGSQIEFVWMDHMISCMTAWLHGRHQTGNQDFSWHDRTMITTVYLTSDDDDECDDGKIDESHVIAWSHDDDNDDDDTGTTITTTSAFFQPKRVGTAFRYLISRLTTLCNSVFLIQNAP